MAWRLFGTGPAPTASTTADAIVLVLFSRSLDTFAGALALVSKGYGAQTMMLNRSLFEDMVDAHWTVTDPDTARTRYEDHLENTRMVTADNVAKYPREYSNLPVPEFTEAERKRLVKLYGRYGGGSWTGFGLHERVGLIEHHWTNEESRYWLRHYRDFAQRENNETLHVSSKSLNAVVRSRDDGGLTFLVGPRMDLLDRAVLGTFWTLAQTMGLVIDHFGIEITDRRRAELFSAKEFVKLPTAQLKTPRNDPCPCGSGLKFKRCHGA